MEETAHSDVDAPGSEAGMNYFKVGQRVKRNDTGEHVSIKETLPTGLKVFYRIEYDSGDTSIVTDKQIREVQPIAANR